VVLCGGILYNCGVPQPHSPPGLYDLVSRPVESFVRHLGEEMEVVTGAPILFALAVLVCALGVWWLFRLLHKRELDLIPILRGQIAAAESELGRRMSRMQERDKEARDVEAELRRQMTHKEEENSRLREQVREATRATTNEEAAALPQVPHTPHPLLPLRAQTELIAVLREHGGGRARVQVQLATRAETPRARLLADVFESAGWETEFSGYPLEPHVPRYFQGIEVRGINEHLARAVTEALRMAGLPGVTSVPSEPVTAQNNPKLDRLQRTVRIIVGHQD
jgi:hypothetical protein